MSNLRKNIISKKILSIVLAILLIVTIMPSAPVMAGYYNSKLAGYSAYIAEDGSAVSATFNSDGTVLEITGYGKISRLKWMDMIYVILKKTGFNKKDFFYKTRDEFVKYYANEYTIGTGPWQHCNATFDIDFTHAPGVVLCENCSAMFGNFEGNIYFHDNPAITKGVNNMNFMFVDAGEFNSPVNFDTSRVTSMQGMFQGAKKFNQPVNFDTSRVISMRDMFNGATNFNQPINFNTSKVIYMNSMFREAESFNQLINLHTPKLEWIEHMFAEASKFNQPVKLDTSKVISFDYVFRNAVNFNQPVNFDASKLVRTQQMFKGAKSFNQPITFDTSKVKKMTEMFNGAKSFNQPITFDVSKVEQAQRMFANTPSFEQNVDLNFRVLKNGSCMFWGSKVKEVRFRKLISDVDLRGMFDEHGKIDYIQIDGEFLNIQGLKIPSKGKSGTFGDINSDWIIENVDYDKKEKWSYGIEQSYKYPSRGGIRIYHKDYITSNEGPVKLEHDEQFFVEKGKSYGVQDLKNKKAIFNGKEINGSWNLSDTRIKEEGEHNLKLSFTPNDEFIPVIYDDVKLIIGGKNIVLQSDDTLEVLEGDNYSANDLGNKKAFVDGKELSGVWTLSDSSIKNVGKHQIDLIFIPNDRKYATTRKRITLNIIKNSGISVSNFKDLKSGEWYMKGISYVVNRGIMNGVGNNNFDPQGKITKAMLVTMLYRLSGDKPLNISNNFKDVKNNEWYTEAAKWSVYNSIAKESSKNIFEPNHKLSREEFVTIIYNYAKHMGYNVSKQANLSKYDDLNKVSYSALVPMKWAVDVGIINGVDATHLSPETGATRAQMATIFMRLIKKYVK